MKYFYLVILLLLVVNTCYSEGAEEFITAVNSTTGQVLESRMYSAKNEATLREIYKGPDYIFVRQIMNINQYNELFSKENRDFLVYDVSKYDGKIEKVYLSEELGGKIQTVSVDIVKKQADEYKKAVKQIISIKAEISVIDKELLAADGAYATELIKQIAELEAKVAELEAKP